MPESDFHRDDILGPLREAKVLGRNDGSGKTFGHLGTST